MSLSTKYLFEYGIHTEKTTHRIHVSSGDRKMFVYQTHEGIDAMPEPISIYKPLDWTASGYYLLASPQAKKSNPGYATARGIRVPYNLIRNCRGINIPEHIVATTKDISTTGKGQLAVGIVIHMAAEGRLPIQFQIREINTKREQILGQDIDLSEAIIQVKHDGPAYEKGLFMQTHEWNPESDH